jgi:serine/threonine protein kinase
MDLSALPTAEKPLTEKGAILGMFQYMAPEQLEAKDTDARTDLFAFGVVLYEMLTGRRAFEGKSQASLIAAILERDPPSPDGRCRAQPSPASNGKACFSVGRVPRFRATLAFRFPFLLPPRDPNRSRISPAQARGLSGCGGHLSPVLRRPLRDQSVKWR